MRLGSVKTKRRAASSSCLCCRLQTVGGSLGMLYQRATTWKSNLPQSGQLISSANFINAAKKKKIK